MHKRYFTLLACFALLFSLIILPVTYAQSSDGISDTIKNFFQHRLDADKTQCLTSISKDYNGTNVSGEAQNYNYFEGSLNDRTEGFSLEALDDFRLVDLKIEDDRAQTKVEFSETIKNLVNDKIAQLKYAGEVFLIKKEDKWKIINMISAERGRLKKAFFSN